MDIGTAVAIAVPTSALIISVSASVIAWIHQKGVSSDNRSDNETSSHQSDSSNATLRQMGGTVMTQCLDHSGIVTALKSIDLSLVEIKTGQQRLWDVVNKALIDNGDKY